MKLLFTGNYDRNYNRNRVILDGLAKNGIEVYELPFARRADFDVKQFELYRTEVDAIYLPSFTHTEVRFIKKQALQKPVIFDPLISKYLTKVFDYQKVSKYSPRAIKNFWKDKWAMKAADLILADTEAHADYFHQTFGVSIQKIKLLPVGVSTDRFFIIPQMTDSPKIRIGFYGSFAPLQGVMKIVEAAHLLQEHSDFEFCIIGNGFDYEKVSNYITKHHLQNVQLIDWLKEEELNRQMNTFDICLGIFGDSLKTNLVIPNKIYHYAACSKAIISKRTTAIQELFQHNKSIQLCDGTADGIRNSILKLAKDKMRRSQVAQAGYDVVTQQYNERAIATLLTDAIEEILEK